MGNGKCYLSPRVRSPSVLYEIQVYINTYLRVNINIFFLNVRLTNKPKYKTLVQSEFIGYYFRILAEMNQNFINIVLFIHLYTPSAYT